MASKHDPRGHAQVARQRVQRLLALAERAALDGRVDDASRYGALAWRLSTRYVLGIGPELKQRVCRSCKHYLLPGRTARTRLDGGKISRTCLACGDVRRVPLS